MASHLLFDVSCAQKYRDLVDEAETPIVPRSRINVLEVDLPTTSSHFQGPRTYSEDISMVPRCSKSPIRIIFGPLDYPTAQTSSLLHTFFELSDIPTAYIHERVQGATQSLNFEDKEDGSFTCWLHFLCKAIVAQPDAPTWHRAGFFLTHDGSFGSTLVCLGASKGLITRLQRLPVATWISILSDPIALLAIVLSDMQATIDEQTWALNDSVGLYEHHAISTTRTKTAFSDNYFQDLHWVAKNVTHLKESADAAMNTCQQLLRVSQQRIQSRLPAMNGGSSTSATLTYLGTLFNGTSLRVTSLHSRIQNTIALSFNLVAQADSHSLRAESSSMHTIAFTTLIFLPISTVATIFGSQFFSFNPPATKNPTAGRPAAAELVLNNEFWLFWVITVPLTLIVLGVWLGFHPEAVARWWRRNITGTGRRRKDEECDGFSGAGEAHGGGSGGWVLQSLTDQGKKQSALTGISTSTTLVSGNGSLR